MKKNLRKVMLGVALLAFVFVAFGNQTRAEHKMLFEKAKYTMETKGDLEEAIKIFEDIIVKFPGEREVAARSQFLIGECYEKLGRSGALRAYELVVANYSDQTDLVSAARLRLSSLQAQSSDMVRVTPISTGDFYLEGGTLSPDGTRLVGVSYEIGQNIAVMNIGENKVTQVTKYDWSQERGIWTHQPVWSPDGKEIAFQGGGWYDKPGVELRTTTLDGKQRTLYTCAKGEGGYPIEWLPKRDLILCQLNSGGVNTLGVLSVPDGKFRPLRKLTGGTDGSSSPDGKYIVFHERKGESRNLSIISTDGETYKPLTEGPADDKQPHWSPGGRHIVFLSHRHGGWALWGIAVDKEGNPAGNPFLIRDGMQNANLRNWTKRGLYYQNWVDTTDVFVASINHSTGEITGKPRQIDYTPTGNNKRPVWSHDGKYLAFASSNEDYAYKGYVVIMPAAGGEAKKFPFTPTQGYSAPWFHCMRWRPDSKAVGLLCRSNGGNMAFFVVDLETGQWQEWPLSRAYDRRTRVEWRGDGKGIYLAQIGRENKQPGIVEHDLESGKESYIYRSKYTEDHIFSDLTCSRDFSKLAIMDGNRYLLVVDTETGKMLQEFTRGENDPMNMCSLAWSPEGDRLFVLNRVTEGRDIKGYSILSIKDGSEKRFESKGVLPRRFTYSDWTPDGTRIAFSTRAMKYDIFILSNIIPKNN